MRRLFSCAILLLLLTGLDGATVEASISLVTNGGFETGNFNGWTQSGNTSATGVATSPMNGYVPHSGNDFAYLGPFGSPGTLSQTLATTPGHSYTLSFWLNSDGQGYNSFSASWDGLLQFSETTPVNSNPIRTGWVEYSVDDLMSTGSDTISFSFQDNPTYLALDDVSVTDNSVSINPVPEPSTLAVWSVLGVLGVVSRLRWRKSASALA